MKPNVAAVLALAASVGVIITPEEASAGIEANERAWRSGFNKTREQARRVRQMQRLAAKGKRI